MRHQRGFTVVELIVALAGLLSLAGVAFLIYILVHFVTKFW